MCVHAIISNLDDSQMLLVLRHALKKINSLIDNFVKITIHSRDDFNPVARHISIRMPWILVNHATALENALMLFYD